MFQISSRSIKMADENVFDVTRTGHAHVASVNILVVTRLVLMPVPISHWSVKQALVGPFQGATIRPIVPRHKHSIVFIVHH